MDDKRTSLYIPHHKIVPGNFIAVPQVMVNIGQLCGIRGRDLNAQIRCLNRSPGNDVVFLSEHLALLV
jgi:hypothetical protein